MTAPIIIKSPLMHVQKLTALGADDGVPVDVSCDIQSVELGIDTPTIDVTTFCGNFSIPDEPTVSASVTAAINADTDANWSGLVGKSVRIELYDRTDATKYRTFDSYIPINPSLYGSTAPGDARTVDFDLAVLSDVAWVTVV